MAEQATFQARAKQLPDEGEICKDSTVSVELPFG
jgi:hypothetical protein